MFELLFLLLPIAAAYGYYMGRSSVSSQRQEVQSKKNVTYLRGVEYLLNNDKERAVDKFIAYLNESDPSFETSLALGNLFRQRGEVDKAISVHESLSLNTEYESAQIEIAKLELARDFLSAGLLDRAEIILTALVDIPRQRRNAASLLVTLYEYEHDYNRAIKAALDYQEDLGDIVIRKLSNFYCQRAESEEASGEDDKALASLQRAIDIDKDSIRARYLLSLRYIRAKDFIKALELQRQISSIDHDAGLVCLEILQKIYTNKADLKYRIELEDLVRRTLSSAAIVELVEVIELTGSVHDAKLLLTSYIKDRPNLKLFSALMRLRSKELDASANDAILQLKSLVDAQIASSAQYSCYRCGFESKMLFWQCPSCRRWNTLKAIRGLAGD